MSYELRNRPRSPWSLCASEFFLCPTLVTRRKKLNSPMPIIALTLQTPHATVHSSLVAEAWFAWHSMPEIKAMQEINMAHSTCPSTVFK